MNIQLKPNQEKFIEEQLKSGRFDNVEQLIDTALHLLSNINEDYLQWREETGHQIDIAVAELDNGEGLEVETVINNILEKFQKERKP
jgi:antitoxin ParD1/3/4